MCDFTLRLWWSVVWSKAGSCWTFSIQLWPLQVKRNVQISVNFSNIGNITVQCDASAFHREEHSASCSFCSASALVWTEGCDIPWQLQRAASQCEKGSEGESGVRGRWPPRKTTLEISGWGGLKKRQTPQTKWCGSHGRARPLHSAEHRGNEKYGWTKTMCDLCSCPVLLWALSKQHSLWEVMWTC